MMDDVEYFAFARRARDAYAGPFRVPDARTLGRRLAGMRAFYGLSVADVADAAGIRHSIVEEFEEYGAVSAESMLWLVEVLCEGDGLGDAFLFPSFSDRGDLIATAARRGEAPASAGS